VSRCCPAIEVESSYHATTLSWANVHGRRRRLLERLALVGAALMGAAGHALAFRACTVKADICREQDATLKSLPTQSTVSVGPKRGLLRAALPALEIH
jgi:hypothetical protein